MLGGPKGVLKGVPAKKNTNYGELRIKNYELQRVYCTCDVKIMAERSEAFVLRKTGGRQDVVQLRTLKQLVSLRIGENMHVWDKCGQLGYSERKKKKKIAQ